jgi:hypothetical protein
MSHETITMYYVEFVPLHSSFYSDFFLFLVLIE